MAFPKPKPGLAILASSLGIDIPDMMNKFQLLMQLVEEFNNRLKRVEENQERTLKFLQDNTEVISDGDASNPDSRERPNGDARTY